ncbi:MAG TPA: hypothetical protein VNF04_09820 [Stellaceae bacterium]|nr:hypothetical protein [Stellaceae bacterium]
MTGMRCIRRITERIAIGAIVIAVAAPAVAGQSAIDADASGSLPGIPPSAASGKPAIVMPPLAPLPDAGPCLAPLPCGSRLIGTVRRNGAVELRVPALRW